VLTLYFCLDSNAPVLRYWCSAPRIGDTVALPELGGNLDPLRVYDVIWEGFEEPSVSIYVHHAIVEHKMCQEQPSNARRNRFIRETGL
jgi:hypothetical protein